MKKIILITLFVCSLLAANSQPVLFNGATRAGGKGWDIVTGITQLPDGRVLVTGAFYDTICFHTDTLVSNGSRDIFIASYKPDGTFEKAVSYGGSGYDYAKKIIPAGRSGFILPIRFNQELQVGGQKFKGKNLDNLLIAKFGKNMELAGSARLGSNSRVELSELETSPDSGCYFTGWYADTLVAESKPWVSKGGADVFLGKISAEGKLSWVKPYEGAGNDIQPSFVAVGNGANYLSGLTTAGCFGSSKAPKTKGEGLQYLYVAQSDSKGNPGEVAYPLRGVAVEPVKILSDSSAVWILANFKYTAYAGETEVASEGGSDILLVRYDLKTKNSSVCRIGGYGNEKAVGMVKSGSRILVAGQFAGQLDFGGQTVKTKNHGTNVFVASVSPGNGPLGIVSMENDGGSFPCVLMASEGGIYIAGEFKGSIQIGETLLQSAGEEDIFLARIEDCTARSPLAVSQTPLDASTAGTSWLLDAGAGFVSYAWGDSLSASRYYTAGEPGSYRVEVTDSLGCVYSETINLGETKSAQIGPKTQEETAFKLYPSATAGMVYWEPATAWGDNKASVRVYDSAGKLATNYKTGPLTAAVYRIDFSGQPDGVYTVEISGSGFREISRVVVKK